MRVSNIADECSDVPVVQDETVHDLACQLKKRYRWPHNTTRAVLCSLRQEIHQTFKLHYQRFSRWLLVTVYLFEYVYDSRVAQLRRHRVLQRCGFRHGPYWHYQRSLNQVWRVGHRGHRRFHPRHHTEHSVALQIRDSFDDLSSRRSPRSSGVLAVLDLAPYV